jgi:hypothetical protein
MSCNDDPRQWVLEHENYGNRMYDLPQTRMWHFYPNGHYEFSICGAKPIPGSPIVAYAEDVTEWNYGNEIIIICPSCRKLSKINAGNI